MGRAKEMQDNENKINFDANNLSFLEQVDDVSFGDSETDVGNTTSELAVDLDSLENLDEEIYSGGVKQVVEASIDAIPVILSTDVSKSAKIKTDWAGYALGMSDVLLKVFELSDRPFIVIRDDKVVYINKTALGILELQNEEGVIGNSFWSFVDQSDWNLLAQNIGAMLTDDKTMDIRMKTDKGRIYKIRLQAIYLDDEQHFTFVLVGDRKLKYNPGAGLYDAITGLPNFYLFEDRLQIAVNNEKFKDVRQKKNMMAVLGVSIDNLDYLKEVNMVDFVFKKLASKLVFRLKKTYTIARGLKYPFWILINDFNNEHDLEVEVEKIKAIFDEPVAGNYMDYNISTSFGYSVYPNNTKTSNKLVELAVEAIKTAIRYKKN